MWRPRLGFKAPGEERVKLEKGGWRPLAPAPPGLSTPKRPQETAPGLPRPGAERGVGGEARARCAGERGGSHPQETAGNDVSKT